MTRAVRGQPTHPRPQLARDGWVDLCGAWSFAFDDADQGLRQGWQTAAEPFDREIVVPYPPESKLSGVQEPSGHPVVWYRRVLEVPSRGDSERVILHFGAVDYRARVWVNGQLVVEHEGGHTPFAADITEALTTSGEQVVVVRAEDPMDDLEQPRGKQDWRSEPHSIWYHRTTGIWQPVWLEVVAADRLTELHWSPQLERAAVVMEARLSRRPDEETWIDVRLSVRGELLAEQSVRCLDVHPSVELVITSARNDQGLEPLLWSPEHPHLIEATVTVRHGGSVVDEVHSYFGFRSVAVGHRRFLLNGRPYFPRMVLEQGYWPDSHLAAPDEDAIITEVERIKQLGFNGVRIHQKVEDPRFLHWCDRLGLLVWGEMPSMYTYSPTAASRLTREWMDVVRRDRSHPCVVTWVPLNESWGVRWIRAREDHKAFTTSLYHLTRALDPSRPVISNDGWEHTTSDIIGIHDYASTGKVLGRRYSSIDANASDWGNGVARVFVGDQDRPGDRPVMITEFGGISFVPEDDAAWGYSTVATAEDFLGRLAGLVGALEDSPAVAGFCYTQLTDTEQETNGLLTADRRPKLPLDRVAAIMSGKVGR